MEAIMKANIFVATLLLFCLGCTSQQSEQFTQQEKDQIKNEIKVVCDSMKARLERLDGEGCFQYFSDSPDWGAVNADGSRWDFQVTKKFFIDFPNSFTAYKWTPSRQDFMFLTKDIVVCAWDGKDEFVLKSGDKITYNPHAMTRVFKKIAGQWKVIYNHVSGIPVTEKAGKQSTSLTKQDEKAIVEAITQLADDLAAAISNRDARRVTAFFTENEYAKYVSDGTVIPRGEMDSTFAAFYGRLETLQFRWDKKEVFVVSKDVASLTAWATYVAKPKTGGPATERAVYTNLCLRQGKKWSILVSHKSVQN
jgi:uncharacterized protein (TIGR02246 family)